MLMRPKIRLRPAWAGLAALLLLNLPFSAGAFSRWQHEVIAVIAEQNLTPEARGEIRRLLGPGTTLASVAAWADRIRPQRPETAPWHYINYPLDRDEPDFDVMETERGNVVWATAHFAGVLADPKTGMEERREALKFLVHFIGDLHQPLHVGAEEDRGGNLVPVLWRGRPTNLHAVWDGRIFSGRPDETHLWGRRLQRGLTEEEKAEIASGTPYDWMVESGLIARRYAYSHLPEPPPGEEEDFRPELSGEYAEMMQPHFKDQLLRAGLRLGRLLNEIFDEEFAPFEEEAAAAGTVN